MLGISFILKEKGLEDITQVIRIIPLLNKVL